ncbi:hypothetical protein [Streptomyces antibioticus]|uniref:hypothetical protein n=1 Tax=Streptomyces antibioticus TaxID=1890 RepID=UPI003D72580C
MTTACTIGHCPRTAPAGSYACPVHADELRAWLAELPAQVRLLEEEFLTPAAAAARGRIGGTGRAHSPVPVDLRVLTLIGPGRYDPTGPDDDGTAPITATLAAWAGHITYTYPSVTRDRHGTTHIRPCEQACPAAGRTVTAWCTWLTRYLPYALTLPAAADLHHDIDHLAHRLRNLTHTEPRTHPRAAPCPECQAFALASTDGHWHIRCTACDHALTPHEYDQHLAAVLQDAALSGSPDAGPYTSHTPET